MSDELQTLSKLMSGEVMIPHTPDLELEEITVVEVDGYGVVHIREECPLCREKLKGGAND